MSKKPDTYNKLTKKYNKVESLINVEFADAFIHLRKAIADFEKGLDYVATGEEIKKEIDRWLHEYGPKYGFNVNCPRCKKLEKEIKETTYKLIQLDKKMLYHAKQSERVYKQSRKLDRQLGELKKEYTQCIEPKNKKHASHKKNH